MKANIGLGAFGTFGSPNGFQQLFYNYKPPSPPTLDLNPSAIEVNPGDEIFAVRKSIREGVITLYFCLYTYAREPESGRRGSFIGSCIVLDNGMSDSTSIYECLSKFHEKNIENKQNVNDGILQVRDVRDLKVEKPDGFERIEENIASFNVKVNTLRQKSYLIDATDASSASIDRDIASFFEGSAKDYLDVENLYFARHSQVIDFVKSKGLIKIIPISEFEESKKQNTQISQQPTISRVLDESSSLVINDKATSNSKSSEELSYSAIENVQASELVLRIWGKPATKYWSSNETKDRISEHNRLVEHYTQLSAEHDELIDKYNDLANGQHRKYRSDQRSRATYFDIRRLLGKAKKFGWEYIVIILLIAAISILGLFFIYIFLLRNDEPPNSSKNAVLPTKVDASVSKSSENNPGNSANTQSSLILDKLNDTNLQGLTAQKIVEKIIELELLDKHLSSDKKKKIEKDIVDLNKECFDNNKTIKATCDKLKKFPE